MRFALDIGGTFVKCAVVSDAGAIVRHGSFGTGAQLESMLFGRSLVEGAKRFLAEYSLRVTMVGAGMPGFVDGTRGFVYESPNLPNVRDFELGRVLSEGLELPAFVENDATSAAWGEFLFGNPERATDLVAVTLGTGVGGGLVLDGRLHRGVHGFAGEIGQMPICPEGPDCPCGGKGCLERYIGKAGLEEDYRKRSGSEEKVEPEEISRRASEGDRDALESWKAYGCRLGFVLAGVSNLLDPGVIVITGGISGAWNYFQKSLFESYNRHVIRPLKDRATVRLSLLGGRAGILGAAFLDRVER